MVLRESFDIESHDFNPPDFEADRVKRRWNEIADTAATEKKLAEIIQRHSSVPPSQRRAAIQKDFRAFLLAEYPRDTAAISHYFRQVARP